MEIAPGIRSSQWKRLTFTRESDWIAGTEIFRRRIEERFLKPVRAMVRLPNAGFAIMALDCLLIETFEQFRRGVPDTPRRLGPEYFRAFLTTTSFGTHFNTTTADLFYETVRNGILHMAELKTTSLLRRGRRFPLVRLSADGRGVEINRSKFHGQLEAEFRDYLALLQTPGSALRAPFRSKMNLIAR